MQQPKYFQRGNFDIEIDESNKIVILIVYRNVERIIQKELRRLERKFQGFMIHEIYYGSKVNAEAV